MTAPGIVIVVLLIFALVLLAPPEPRITVIEDPCADQIAERDTCPPG